MERIMFTALINKWLRSHNGARVRCQNKPMPVHARLGLEYLEGRIAPAILDTWNGNSTDWFADGNWSLNHPPRVTNDPNTTNDVRIPELASGKSYPVINLDAVANKVRI